MSLLEVRNLTIELGSTVFVKNLNFEAKEGKTLAIIGESGSGKTLTALAIMGLLQNSKFSVKGIVSFLGENFLDKQEKEMKKLYLDEIAMVAQNPFKSLSPVQKIKENINTIHKIKKRKVDIEKLESLFEKMELDMHEILKKYPYECSGGQLQRVMVLLSILFEPRLLLCDEITCSLDYDSATALISLLQNLKEKNEMSIIFISHDISLVQNIADDVLIMKEGKIVEKGSISEIFGYPREPYTQELINAACLERIC